jgi:hypothetical protein
MGKTYNLLHLSKIGYKEAADSKYQRFVSKVLSTNVILLMTKNGCAAGFLLKNKVKQSPRYRIASFCIFFYLVIRISSISVGALQEKERSAGIGTSVLN